MKSYCVKQRKQTECVSGSEQYVKTKNGRNAMKCKCVNVELQSLDLLKVVLQEALNLKLNLNLKLELDQKQSKVKDYF